MISVLYLQLQTVKQVCLTHLSVAKTALSLYKSHDLDSTKVNLQVFQVVLGHAFCRTPSASVCLAPNSVYKYINTWLSKYKHHCILILFPVYFHLKLSMYSYRRQRRAKVYNMRTHSALDVHFEVQMPRLRT